MNTNLSAKDIGRLWFEKVWNERDRDLLFQLMAADAIGDLEGGQRIVGPLEFIEFQKQFLQTLPDLHIKIEESLAVGDEVCIHWAATGTHTGTGMSLTPTGQKITFRGVSWLKTQDGQVTAGRDFWNLAGLMKTLRAEPDTM